MVPDFRILKGGFTGRETRATHGRLKALRRFFGIVGCLGAARPRDLPAAHLRWPGRRAELLVFSAMSRSRAPVNCAVCGAEIPPGTKACPECGADDRTGWRESSIYDGLDLPDDEFNHEVLSKRSLARIVRPGEARRCSGG